MLLVKTEYCRKYHMECSILKMDMRIHKYHSIYAETHYIIYDVLKYSIFHMCAFAFIEDEVVSTNRKQYRSIFVKCLTTPLSSCKLVQSKKSNQNLSMPLENSRLHILCGNELLIRCWQCALTTIFLLYLLI